MFVLVVIISSFSSSLRLSDESKVWLAEAKDAFDDALRSLESSGYSQRMNCPVILRSALDDRGESLEAPVRELTDELSEGAVRGGGRLGRTLVNYDQANGKQHDKNCWA